MALPIILNLRRRRRRRAEHTERGLGLVDHADRLTETKTEGRREMKGEKLENGKDTKRKKKKKTTPATTKAAGKATRPIRKMLLSPLNHASLGVRLMFFVLFLNGLGCTYEALFVPHTILFPSCQLQSISICAVFQATN